MDLHDVQRTASYRPPDDLLGLNGECNKHQILPFFMMFPLMKAN